MEPKKENRDDFRGHIPGMEGMGEGREATAPWPPCYTRAEDDEPTKNGRKF